MKDSKHTLTPPALRIFSFPWDIEALKNLFEYGNDDFLYSSLAFFPKKLLRCVFVPERNKRAENKMKS